MKLYSVLEHYVFQNELFQITTYLEVLEKCRGWKIMTLNNDFMELYVWENFRNFIELYNGYDRRNGTTSLWLKSKWNKKKPKQSWQMFYEF